MMILEYLVFILNSWVGLMLFSVLLTPSNKELLDFRGKSASLALIENFITLQNFKMYPF